MSPRTRIGWITTLNHEVGDHPKENSPIIESSNSQSNKIPHSPRSFSTPHVNFQLPYNNKQIPIDVMIKTLAVGLGYCRYMFDISHFKNIIIININLWGRRSGKRRRIGICRRKMIMSRLKVIILGILIIARYPMDKARSNFLNPFAIKVHRCDQNKSHVSSYYQKNQTGNNPLEN